jgi:hypothetical protein
MFKVSKCHCLFNSNCSIQITLLTHPFSPQNTGEANATNRHAETFTSADSLLRSDSKGLACTDKKCCHIE